MCMHSALVGGEQQAAFLLKAQELGLTQGQYVFVPYDALLYSLPYGNTSYNALNNSSELRKAYDAVLTITVESEVMSFYQALNMAKLSEELPATLEPQQVSWLLLLLLWMSPTGRFGNYTEPSLNTLKMFCVVSVVQAIHSYIHLLICSFNEFD